MKKSIFILATLFAATLANAQIVLKHTFDGWITISADFYGDCYHYVQAPYFYNLTFPTASPIEPEDPPMNMQLRSDKKLNENKCVLNLYDIEDFSLYKTIEIDNTSGSTVCLVSRNILSTDDKVCFCIMGEEQSEIYNEDGELIATIKGNNPALVEVNDKYLLISRQENDKTYIYSVPGNGELANVSKVSAPRYNTRKYLHDNQVLFDSNERTYNMQGQQVK